MNGRSVGVNGPSGVRVATPMQWVGGPTPRNSDVK